MASELREIEGRPPIDANDPNRWSGRSTLDPRNGNRSVSFAASAMVYGATPSLDGAKRNPGWDVAGGGPGFKPRCIKEFPLRLLIVATAQRMAA